MTIKEIETLSGLPRANIRYYESEGLIAPKRAENGYREYSQADAEVLLRVKLHAEQENLDAAGRVAAGLRQAHAEFSTLDAAGYLGELLAASQTALRQDVKSYVHAPVRRYIARSFDLLLCSLPWYLVLQAAGVDPKERLTSIWLSILGMVTMLVLEPLLLRLFGTTPGKWLMGLRVTDENGQRLPLAAAWRRTWRALWYGYGCFIPVYSIVRLYTSWKAEQAEQPREWEDGSELRAAPWKAWRGAAWAAAVLALLAATVLVGLKTCQPTHTGDLTVRKFAENYDYIHSTEGLLSRELYDDGTWAPATQLGFQVIHHTKNVPNLSYTTKDGSLIDISLHMGAEACTSPVYGLPFRELYLTMLAFDGARTAASADEALAAAARQLLDEPLQELHTQAAGYQIDYSLTTTGFTGLAEDGSLELPRNTTGSYMLSFDMRKLDG